MPTLVIGKLRKAVASNLLKKHLGFTLIEILIVIVILTIVASMSLLATGDFGRERKIQTASEELQSLCTLLQTRAILTGSVLGIRFLPNSYRFYEFNSKRKSWMPIQAHKLFLPAHLPDGMHFVVKNPSNNKDNEPNATVLPGGELSPLTVIIENGDHPVTTLIVENDHFSLRAPQ